jgi:hypothetical protein
MQVQVEHFTNRPLYKTHALQISSLFLAISTPRPRPAQIPAPTPGARDAGRRRGGGGRVGRRAAPLPPPHLPPGGGGRRGGGAGPAAAGAGRGRRPLAGQGARDVLRGGRRGREHGAAHLGAHRRAVGPARHRLRDHAPHEASGKRGRPSVSTWPSLSACACSPTPRAASARVLFSRLYWWITAGDGFQK